MVYGYARVSTEDQNLERQLMELRKYVENDRYIVCDKCSGKDFDRPGYVALTGSAGNIPLLRDGDVLVIMSIDRLGRNYSDIKDEWRRLTQMGVLIKVIDMPLLDMTVDRGLDFQFLSNIVLELLSYVAERERKEIKKRQRQGIDAMPIIEGKRISTKTGCPTGRPEIPFPEQWAEIYDKWQNEEITATEAIRILGLKRTTFYRLVGKYKREKGIA